MTEQKPDKLALWELRTGERFEHYVPARIEAGVRPQRLAAEFGVDASTLRRWIRDRGGVWTIKWGERDAVP